MFIIQRHGRFRFLDPVIETVRKKGTKRSDADKKRKLHCFPYTYPYFPTKRFFINLYILFHQIFAIV